MRNVRLARDPPPSHALGAAVFRSLACRPQALAPAVDGGAGHDAVLQMTLADAPRAGQPAALARWRGRLDALALRASLSDARSYTRDEPPAGVARTLFSLLEQNRVESLGARRLIGVEFNLAALAEDGWVRARPEGVIRGDASTWVETFALLTRIALAAPLPAAAAASLRHTWMTWMSPAEVREVQLLAPLLDDQRAFAAQSLRVIDVVLGAASDSSRPFLEPRGTEEPASDSRTPSPVGCNGPQSRAILAPRDPDTEAEAGVPGVPMDAAVEPPSYRVFTRAFDVERNADELYDGATLAQLRRELDDLVGDRLSGINRWAHRLQRKLLGLQLRSWRFDADEGVLDAGRLSRIATHPLERSIYKHEVQGRMPATAVTLLIDNSGSMRGVPIATAATCAAILGRVLERCGVTSEVLGFTTRAWRGGSAHRQWTAAGRPKNPGRLSDLLHIVYKGADQPWRRDAAQLAAMLGGGLLKENVDGEGLLWAHRRLQRRTEPRKILIVLSDGAPLDESTRAANAPGLLERHLRAVIDWIEERSSVELAAVGIGHDVRGYYRRAVTLSDADQLGEAMVTQLIDLMDAPRGTRRSFIRR